MKYEVVKSISGSVWYIYEAGCNKQVAATSTFMFNDPEKAEAMANKIANLLNEYEAAHDLP